MEHDGAAAALPPTQVGPACPTCAFIDAKPGQARVSWRGGSAAVASRRRTGWGDYARLRGAPNRLLIASGAPQPPSPFGLRRDRPLARRSFSEGGSPPLASLAGGGEKARSARGVRLRHLALRFHLPQLPCVASCH